MPDSQQHDAKPSRTEGAAQRASAARRVNGIVAGVVLVVFVLHGLSAGTPLSLPNTLVIAGCVLIGFHVITSIATSAFMLGDKVRPPSTKKKQHLLLKWVSGLALGGAACAHVLGALPFGKLFLTAIVLLITWHAWICTRSFLKDIGVSTQRKPIFRAVLCVAAAATILLLWV